MTRIANLPLALLLLTTALTGCLDGNDSTDLEETTIIQNSADIATLQYGRPWIGCDKPRHFLHTRRCDTGGHRAATDRWIKTAGQASFP